jgi:hypothetical protein
MHLAFTFDIASASFLAAGESRDCSLTFPPLASLCICALQAEIDRSGERITLEKRQLLHPVWGNLLASIPMARQVARQ